MLTWSALHMGDFMDVPVNFGGVNPFSCLQIKAAPAPGVGPHYTVVTGLTLVYCMCAA